MIGIRVAVGASLLPFLCLVSATAAAPAPWVVPDAPYRAVIKLSQAPTLPAAGIAVTLPEFGSTMERLADVVMTDAKGQQQPLAVVWRGSGEEALLLAQELQKGQEYYVYFGGNVARPNQAWDPTISLLMETRHNASGGNFETWPALEAAWHNTMALDGAGWVDSIYQGMNPFGDDHHFLSHFTGYLRTDKMPQVTLYTISSDASFVLVNNAFEFGWPGDHASNANAKNVHSKSVACSGPLTRIDYYQAKSAEGRAEMVLGWQQGEKFEAIPPDAWVHPGKTELIRIEEAHGWPAPIPIVDVRSYMGYTNQWLYEVTGSLLGGVPDGWSVQWNFSDGTTSTQKDFTHITSDTSLQYVTVKLRRENAELSGVRRVQFLENIPASTIQSPSEVQRYMDAMTHEDLAALPLGTLRSYIIFLDAINERPTMATLAEAWLKRDPDPADPLWLPLQLSRLQAMAQTDPERALAELRRIPPAPRAKYAAQLDLLELDIMVFALRDPSSVERATQISMRDPKSETARLALVRAGDYYRLQGRYADAIAEYQQAQKSVIEDSDGRKLPAQDRAYSITINDLLERDETADAERKLTEWEAHHPMAKLDSDFLILRGRILIALGRWREALAEIESFESLQPESPYQIDADFYRACALYDLGQREPARKIWKEIVEKYPLHALVGPSREWLSKP